jgi:hypothetical protein
MTMPLDEAGEGVSANDREGADRAHNILSDLKRRRDHELRRAADVGAAGMPAALIGLHVNIGYASEAIDCLTKEQIGVLSHELAMVHLKAGELIEKINVKYGRAVHVPVLLSNGALVGSASFPEYPPRSAAYADQGDAP